MQWEEEMKEIEKYTFQKIEKHFEKEDLNKKDVDENENALVLITRKGYWLFKQIQKSERIRQLIKERNVDIITDRYVLKENYEWVQGKNICIFDDTVTNGNNLFFFYSILRKHRAKKVVPLVCSASTEFFKKKADESKLLQYRRAHRNSLMLEREMEENCKEEFFDFKKALEYERILTPDEIALFSKRELLWFQKETEPMVMDLPVFRYKDAERKEKIVLSEEEYAKICEWSKDWEFVENNYHELDEIVNCDFFQLNDSLLYGKIKDLFFNFIVKCKWYPLEDGRIQMVFIPFAMIKSIDFLGIWKYFKILLEGTDYYKEVYKQLGEENLEKELDEMFIINKMKKNHNLCRGIYRAVVFSLSNYIACRFREKIRNDIGMELFLDEEYLKENSKKEFYKTFLKEYEEFNEEEYLSKVDTCRFINLMPYVNKNIVFDGKREIADSNKIELYVRERILSTRYEKNIYKKRIVTIEDLEYELEERFLFRSDAEKKMYLTKALILLLELSCSGNELMVSNENEMIYRGFKAGENSEILMAAGGKWIYPYIYAYYFLVNEDFYVKHFDMFASWIMARFEKAGYTDTLISSENLRYFLRYYQGMEKEHLYEQIMSKSYLINSDVERNGKEDRYERFFGENAFISVCEWGDKIHGGIY